MSNTELWHKVRTPDPAFTKPITGKGYRGTAVSFPYVASVATEAFGPCGIGWGWDITDERIERLTDTQLLHIARVTLWYVWKGQRGEVPHIGQTMLVTKNGHADEDAPKKSVTDALLKALSCVGFAADIHMGLFDDNKYVAQVERDFAANATAPVQVDVEQAAVTEAMRNWAKQAKEAATRWNDEEAAQAWVNSDRNRKALEKLQAAAPELYAEVERAIDERRSYLLERLVRAA